MVLLDSGESLGYASDSPFHVHGSHRMCAERDGPSLFSDVKVRGLGRAGGDAAVQAATTRLRSADPQKESRLPAVWKARRIRLLRLSVRLLSSPHMHGVVAVDVEARSLPATLV